MPFCSGWHPERFLVPINQSPCNSWKSPPPCRPSTGTLMELEDCAFPLLAETKATDKADEAFEGADWVILVGGLPRKDGMSRADLIRANGPIFTGQGKRSTKPRVPTCGS